MKTILLLILLSLGDASFSATYFISPNGNDKMGKGTIDSPWFTLNKAWSVVTAGDIVYLRGGIYFYSTGQRLTDRNGTVTDTIKIYAYKNEKPVLTRANTFTSLGLGNSLVNIMGNYIHLKGMEIRNFTDPNNALMWTGLSIINATEVVIERVNSHHNGRGMLVMEDCNNNLILNCDFHENYDPYTTKPYSNGDGLEINSTLSGTTNTIRGCRFYYNADDGLDLWSSDGMIIIENCWAWGNGYREDKVTAGGDGDGFKLGSTSTLDGTTFARKITNCLAFLNRETGFNQNGANCMMYFYNNTAYLNGLVGISFGHYDLASVFNNNLSYSNEYGDWKGEHTNVIIDHSSYDANWQPNGPIIRSADFVTMDTTGVSGKRQLNGNLPVLRFLKPAIGSVLIDAGIDVGMEYDGLAPDIGAYNYSLPDQDLPESNLQRSLISKFRRNTNRIFRK